MSFILVVAYRVEIPNTWKMQAALTLFLMIQETQAESTEEQAQNKVLHKAHSQLDLTATAFCWGQNHNCFQEQIWQKLQRTDSQW